MSRFQRYQAYDKGDDDDEQQPTRRGQDQDDDDENDDQPVGRARQQQGQDDDDDDNPTRARGQAEVDDDEDEDEDEDEDVDEDVDEDEEGKRGQRGVGDDNEEGDDENEREEIQQQEEDDDETPPLSPPPDDQPDTDEDDGDELSAKKSATVNVNFNINLDLDNSALHTGGTIFSKKLLAQLFSGPGEHDPHEEEVGVHNIEHEHVETSDDGEWTIVELKTVDATGATIYLKAKLDSGADDNFMSFDIFEVTGLDFTPYEGPEGPPSFTTGSGDDTTPIGTVKLAYTAGVKPQKFIETFQVLEGLPHDVIIGKPLMTTAHMIMVDPNFAHPPEHKKLALLELPPKQKDSKAKALAFQKQRAEEQAAAYEAKFGPQETAAAPESTKKSFFSRFGKHK